MKNTDFRNFLDAVDALEAGKPVKKQTLKESPGDTWYVSKMREKFIAMEADANAADTAPVAPVVAPMQNAAPAEQDQSETPETLTDEELEEAVAHLRDICEDHDEQNETHTCDDLYKVMKHFGYDMSSLPPRADETQPEQQEESKTSGFFGMKNIS